MIMKKKIIDKFKNFIKILRKPEMQILPGQLAFYFLMSFVPIIALASLVVSFINNDYNLIEIFTSHLPEGLANILVQFIDSSVSGTNFIILFFCYLVMGLHGPYSIIITSNTIYGVSNSNFIENKSKACAMTFVMIFLLIFIILIPVLGVSVFKFIDTPFFRSNPWIIDILKFIVTFFVIYCAIKFIYFMALDKHVKNRKLTAGSLFTALGWVVFSRIFSFYILNIAKYNALYGNFANILVLLLWTYFLAYLFVVGMAINVEVYNNSDNKLVGK